MDLEQLKAASAENRQIAYENKVCKKIIARRFKDDKNEFLAWTAKLKLSKDPLADVQELFSTVHIFTHRFQSWDLHSLLNTSAVVKSPIWKEFAPIIDECAKSYPDKLPAMIFYNQVINQDMVIHLGLGSRNPPGHFRLVRESNSGEGGVVIDTLDGFLEVF